MNRLIHLERKLISLALASTGVGILISIFNAPAGVLIASGNILLISIRTFKEAVFPYIRLENYLDTCYDEAIKYVDNAIEPELVSASIKRFCINPQVTDDGEEWAEILLLESDRPIKLVGEIYGEDFLEKDELFSFFKKDINIFGNFLTIDDAVRHAREKMYGYATKISNLS